MSIKRLQTKVKRIKDMAAAQPSSQRDELLQEIEELERTIQKLVRRSKEERQRTIHNIMTQLGAMNPADARQYIVKTFDKAFFEDEFDLPFKEELAVQLYHFCKTDLQWNYDFLKRMAFILE